MNSMPNLPEQYGLSLRARIFAGVAIQGFARYDVDMNYHHHYHAGNFADVFKHVLLLELLTFLQKKDKGFCYLETHAGAGWYDLTALPAQKTQEYLDGVGRLLPLVKALAIERSQGQGGGKNIHPAILRYLSLVQPVWSDKPCYPGSPILAQQILRPQDRMVLCELHEETYCSLKKYFPSHLEGEDRGATASIHHRNGYEALKALLPPQEKRGLVFIDPSFESQDEFVQLEKSLSEAVKRWPTGVYVVWYPNKHLAVSERFLRTATSLGLSLQIDVINLDFKVSINPWGCGLLILNPPYQFEQSAKTILTELQSFFA